MVSQNSERIGTNKRRIKIERTAPYSPAQSGVAERKNQTLIEMAQCMLLDVKLELRFGGSNNRKYINQTDVQQTYVEIKPEDFQLTNGSVQNDGDSTTYENEEMDNDSVITEESNNSLQTFRH